MLINMHTQNAYMLTHLTTMSTKAKMIDLKTDKTLESPRC